MSNVVRKESEPSFEDGELLTPVLQALPRYLMKQRWYPVKNAAPPEVTLRTLIPFQIPGLAAALAIWRAAVPHMPAIDLFLPLAIRTSSLAHGDDAAEIAVLPSGGGVIVDALSVDSFVYALVGLMANACTGPAFVSGVTAGFSRLAPLKDQTIQRSRAEQSNTSICIGDLAMLKVVRKLSPGIHPELEMGRFLTEQAQFRSVAALLGWIQVKGMTVGVLQEFVSHRGDGWTWTLSRLKKSQPAAAETIPWIRKLGTRTAEMHAALAIDTEDTAFSAEAARPADWQRWTAGVEDMTHQVFRALAERTSDLDEASRSIVSEFEQRRSLLVELCEALRTQAPSAQITRHHGDYHLGQVLVSGEDDVTIVDFEGEPSRDLYERRAKHIPLRDVAGMLRSFAYVAAVAQRDLQEGERAEQAPPSGWLESWVAVAGDAYLDGYFSALPPGLNPPDRNQAMELVRFFSIEKALYEVLYEIRNRPQWVSIPLGCLLALLHPPRASEATQGSVASHSHTMPFGARVLADGGVLFRLWAPKCSHLQLLIDEDKPLPMHSVGEGWHERAVPEAKSGTRYRFLLPDGTLVPDPASRSQPDDVHGPSEVIEPAEYAWQTMAWAGRPWHETVIYELHMGTFTAEGTFRGAMARLDYLRELGITAIEIMPIADFPGSRNWGYDGVLSYAPDSSYGRPDDFKAFIDAAHARGIQVLLDVVYNHFGPDGNYLPAYAPGFFTDRHKTPWGAAVNFDGTHSTSVREFVIHNALYWLEEFQLDGLRLDAVHTILDDSEVHVLEELAQRARALGRRVHLILENEENKATLLRQATDGTPQRYTAQWNDDVHHVLHVAATGEGQGYYADYLGQTELLGRALAEGFAFQGQLMAYRGSPRGEPSATLSPGAFVAFIQNHDQIGNRAFGERISALAAPEAILAIAAVYLLLPQVPMLFMGEEWGTAQPFPFFSSFGGDLAEAVRQGRRQEFAKFPEFQDEASRARIPDPEAEGTFLSAKLNWEDLSVPEHRAWHDHYQRLLTVRRESVQPLLPKIKGNAAHYRVVGPGAVVVQWTFPGGALELAANLSGNEISGFSASSGTTIWREGRVNGGRMAPWSVVWGISERESA